MNKVYIFIIVVLVLILLMLTRCVSIGHDYWNPCTDGPGYDDKVCGDWKERFSGEYKKYGERMETRPFKEKKCTGS